MRTTVIIRISATYFKTRFLDRCLFEGGAYSFWKFPMQISLQKHIIFDAVQYENVQISVEKREIISGNLVYFYRFIDVLSLTATKFCLVLNVIRGSFTNRDRKQNSLTSYTVSISFHSQSISIWLSLSHLYHYLLQ